jgi:outer membrane receptor protein involved in Fe transport
MFGPTVLMACRMPLRKCLSQVSLAAALACAWQTGLAAGTADDLVELPFEQLLETEVTGAAGFVREVTDAPSAVSVVTAEDIKRFGYRTLAEVLENLPGLVLDYDGAYYYVGARGYGLPGQYYGRFMLLIDGYPAADNVYNQIYLGDDGLLDVSLIDRVEYAPGPGAGVYGNNAFLGVIHVFTRKGRDIDGGELAASWGTHNDRKTRLNLGGRTEEGADWVFSMATRESDVKAWSDTQSVSLPSRDQRLFFKARHGGWWLETALARRELSENPTDKGTDTYGFWQLGRDVDWSDWRATFRIYQGGYDYGFKWSDSGVRSTGAVGGTWWGGQAQLATSAWAGHRVAVGLEYRADQRLRLKYDEFDEADGSQLSSSVTQGNRARNLGVYVQDEIELSPGLDLSLALRHDRHFDGQKHVARTNPRLALVYRPGADTSFKLSHGTASRWSSWDEIRHELGDGVEKVRTTELVADQRWPALGLRTVGSVYRYRMSDLLASNWVPGLTHYSFTGMELALEWRWHAALIKASYARQRARQNDGAELFNSPSDVGKVQVSLPLVADRWRASLALRAVGDRVSELRVPIPGYMLTDLTFLGRNVVSGLDVTFGIRNLFGRSYGSAVHLDFADERGVFVRDGRTYWLQLEYRFK